MSRSQNSFIKNQKEKKRQQKKKEKEEKKKERQENNAKGGDLSDMLAYVDEYGNIVETSPEERAAKAAEAKKIADARRAAEARSNPGPPKPRPE